MREYHEKRWAKRYHDLGGSHAPRIMRIVMAFVSIMIMLRVSMQLVSPAQRRPKFKLMDSERCVPLNPGHLENSFVRRGTCFSRRQVQQIITDLVVDSSAVFDAYKLTFFLDSGTLLGSYRTGSVIPHDQDADMGMDVKSIDFLRNNPIAFPSKYELHVHNSTLHPQGTRFDGLPAKVVHKASGLYMDIFEYIDGTKTGLFEGVLGTKSRAKVTGPLPSDCFGSCYACPHVGPGKWQFQVPYDWIYPLQDCAFGGRTLKCPAQPEKYLQHMYGSDYVTPDYDYDNES